MSVFTKLRHALLGRPQPKVTRLESADMTAMRIDELPPFNLHIADLMRFDPQVRIGLATRNGLLMAAEVEIAGDDERINRWVQHQWDALWNGSSHQLLRAKLYGFQPFEVVYQQAAGGEFRGLIEVERLIDHPPGKTRLLVAEDKIVGFTVEEDGRTTARMRGRGGERERGGGGEGGGGAGGGGVGAGRRGGRGARGAGGGRGWGGGGGERGTGGGGGGGRRGPRWGGVVVTSTGTMAAGPACTS